MKCYNCGTNESSPGDTWCYDCLMKMDIECVWDRASANKFYDRHHPVCSGKRGHSYRVRQYGERAAFQFKTLSQLQKGKCPICGLIKPLVLDHDHASGEFRGAICGDCNRGLGCFRDNGQSLQRAIDYLNGLPLV